MSLRNTWRFTYKGKDLLPAAQAMVAYHQQHVEYWTGELGLFDQEIRDHAVKLSELGATGGAGFRIDLDVVLAEQYNVVIEQYNVAMSNVRTHTCQRDLYQQFVLAFGQNLDQDLDLDVDDISFFRISAGPPDD
jgi:hypothetical protein